MAFRLDNDWDRFITIDNDPIWHVGNVCGTCEFFFKTFTSEKQQVIEQVRDSLNEGIDSIEEIPGGLLKLLPNGEYIKMFFEVNPKLAGSSEMPDYFRTELIETWPLDDLDGTQNSDISPYYRTVPRTVKKSEAVFDFYIPQYDPALLDDERVEYYIEQLRKGEIPTVVSVSVLDIKGPALWPVDEKGNNVESRYGTHWCFSNYILDGHHKMYASYKSGIPITILSFLSLEHSWKFNIKDFAKAFE